MLTIRLQRIGKIHNAEYRVVVAEKRNHVSKQVHEVLGNYSPHTKKLTIKTGADVQKYLDLNIETSATVTSILKKNGFEKKAAITKTPKTKKVVETKTEEKPVVKKPVAKKNTKK
jgi:small subunit ribosomal protein S16